MIQKTNRFFQSLVPGPRSLNAKPEAIQFWLQRLHERDSEKTFPVGVVYGPSGSGKSSLVRAGIVPHLQGCNVVLVSANQIDTTERIKSKFASSRNTSIDRPLAETFKEIRLNAKRKTILVIDQFEQWLHTWKLDGNDELIQALLQCDGANLQVLLISRDDFWMELTRLMRELDLKLIEKGKLRCDGSVR